MFPKNPKVKKSSVQPIRKVQMQYTKECRVCQSTQALQDHHILYGEKNRKWSEIYGLKIWLCLSHHTGPQGIHHNKKLDDEMKREAQMKFLQIYSMELWMEIFKKNYLEG